MSVPRNYQFIALKRLAAGGRQSRQLHMTGPATFPSPLLTGERPASNLPRDIAGLRAECKRRKLDFSGGQQELMSRLSADELAHSRAFTTAVNASKRPTAESKVEEAKPVRHFNTSRALKAVNDSSTIDFAYLPDNIFDPENPEAAIRVPLLPTNFFPPRTGAHALEADEEAVLKPTVNSISTNGDDSRISTISELSDNSAMAIDFTAMAERVATATKRNMAPMMEQSSILKQLWDGLVEDLRGQPTKPTTH
ncbi:hypothetical protein AAFC00_003737 [Neodothiora populina]|uniref:SAP domain-containing protein n=1 Tax=Neodothiora populina TaxID=2781224 RepID=A0ABR3PFA3_9PEZI